MAVIGAGGRVGLPLSLAFADLGYRVVGIDIDGNKNAILNSGKMPFDEEGCKEILIRCINSPDNRIFFTHEYNFVAESEYVIIVPGTPLADDGAPDMSALTNVLEHLAPLLRPGHIVILRSTVMPGTTEAASALLADKINPDLFNKIHFAIAPERLVEGKALHELHELPQIIGTTNERTYERVAHLFAGLGVETLMAQPLEAELAKLFANNFRYIQFALANEFFMICNNLGVNFERIRRITNYKYPRSNIAKSGFARGPCLGKDSWLLMNSGNRSPLQSHLIMSAYLVNETLPEAVVAAAKEELGSLIGKNALVLGLAFKRNSDDIRSSLSPKLISLLKSEFVRTVEIHDPFIKPEKLERKISDADVIFLATNHSAYENLNLSKWAKPDCLVVDVWYHLNEGMGHVYYCRDV